MNRIGRAATLASLLLSAGCYKYVTADLGAVPKDEYVRVYLTRRGLADIPREIPASTSYLTGRFAGQTPDSLLVQVQVSRSIEGQGLRDLFQNVYIPLGEVISVDRRMFSGGKTALAVAGSVGFISIAALGIAGAGGSSDAQKGSNSP